MNNNKKELLDQAVQRFKSALRGCTVREQYKIARKGATLYIVSRTPGRYYTNREYR